MSLGYALLHRNRIQVALEAGPRKRTYDDLTDFMFGILGSSAGDMGEGVVDFAQGRVQWFNDLMEQQMERFIGENGPFSFIRNLLDRIGNIDGIADLTEEFFTILGNINGISLRENLHQWIDKLCDAIPDLSGEALNRFLMEQVNEITSVLEQPLISGRRDVTAHRSFRAAVTLRQYISEGLDEAPWANAAFDIKSIFCQTLHQVVASIDDTAISGFMEFFQSFQREYGGLMSASFRFSAGVSVSSAGGPQGMPGDDPGYLDEVKAVSHTSPGGMWGLDLATNILATFFLVWESVRTDNYKGRWFDGTLSVITILWQAAGHTLVRAAWPESINRQNEDSAGNVIKNWLFTDQGNFSLNFLIRLFQSFHDGGGSNWALSFAQRVLKYFSNVTIIRSFYYFVRSVWYFKDRAAADNPQPVSMVRMFWAIWGPMSWISTFFSFFLSWDDFSLEEGLNGRTIGLLVAGLLVGFITGYIVLWVLADQRPGSLRIAPDWWTLVLTFVVSIVSLVALGIILADLESGSTGAAIAGTVSIGIVTLMGIGLPALFHFRTEEYSPFLETLIEIGMFFLLLFSALLVAGVLPFFLWWFFIDDGRDKHGLFDDKDADTSPYKLPYPAGENWLCGQGVHGIFSHIPTDFSTNSIDNEYAYDFNEKENKNAFAARDGIVLEVEEGNVNKSNNANNIDVMHTSWHPDHDPGTDNERVLTYSTYFHLSQNTVRVEEGHRFEQGVHLADIDSTGRSAQHHLHFHAEEFQRGGRNVTIPVVFQDSSTHRFRNFPFLAWIPGKGHVAGKPLSMALYTSDNEGKDPLVHPITLSLDSQGTPAHDHQILLDLTNLTAGNLPDSLLVRTTANTNHYHEITFTRDQLLEMLRGRVLSGMTVSQVNTHQHTVTGHVDYRGGSAQPTLDIVEPTRAQLLAENPGPYNLVGDQMVIRVNERATEYFFYGAHRPRLRGEIALDRGLGNPHTINIGGFNHTPSTTDTTVQGSFAAFNSVLAARTVQARVEPVIVLETLQRGSGASIVVDSGSSVALEHIGEGRGSGEFAHIDQATHAQLVNHFTNYLTNGWPSAPGTVAAQVDGNNRLVMQVSGAAITFPDKKTRNSEVLRRLYDTANARLRATSDIPLSSGRIDLTNSYGVPVLGTAAQVIVDTSHSAFAGTDLTATPLEVTVRGRTTAMTLSAGDNVAGVLARKITLNVEGVRAWEAGANQVKVQTVAVGDAIRLEVRKRFGAGDFHQQNSGDAPNLTVSTIGCSFSGVISDSNALAPNQCCAIIHTALANATLPYDSGVVIDQIQMDGNQLVIRVNSGHTVSATAVKFSGGIDPFGFTQTQPHEIRSTNLAANVDLNGPGWVELNIDGHAIIIPFDAEPARVDLILTERLPASGENLTLNINGAGNSTLAFTGNEGSVGAITTAIAQQFSHVSVRIAYRISFENALYGQSSHNLQLNNAPGLAMAGFLNDRSTYTTTCISASNHDQMAVAANLLSSLNPPDDGVPVSIFTMSEPTPGTFHIDVPAGNTVNMTSTPSTDPLGMSGFGTSTLSTATIPAELKLPSQCQRYDFNVLDGAGNIVAISRLQIAAAPAMMRTEADFSATLPGNTVLPVTVVEPDTSSTTVDRVFSVELSGVNSLADVVHRLNSQVPAIRAWIATPSGNQRLHVESRGYGHGWKLRLGNPPLLLALGFTDTQVDLNAQQLEVEGRGDVQNGAKMTQEEVRNALSRIDQCTTQAVYLSGQPRSLMVKRSGTSDLVLSSVEGPVTVETDPTSIKQALNVVESGGTATLSPGSAQVALDCGIINIKAGGRSVAAVRLFADHATITAEEPLATAGSPAETQQLNLLKAHALIVRLASTTPGQPVGPLPASITSLTAAVAWYAQNLSGEVWIGINPSNHVILQTRRRGNASLFIELDFANFMTETFAPGDTLLGFVVAPVSGGNVWQFSGQGLGNVTDMNTIPVWSTAPASIEGYLSTAAQQGASRQAIYDVEVDSSAGPTDLRIRSQVATRTLNHPVPPASNPVPGGIQFSVAGGGLTGTILETNFSLAPPVRPGELSLEVTEAGVTRSVVALIAGAPARLVPLIFPANLNVLNGTGFDIVLTSPAGTITTHSVQFSGVSTQQQVTAQVEQQCQWKVRANISGGAMIIETIGAGSAFVIALRSPSVTSNAVTNNNATGFVAGSIASPVSLPLNGRGGGTVPDMDNINADHYKNALLDAYLVETTVRDRTSQNRRQMDFGVYELNRNPSLYYFTLESLRNGCMSSLEPIVHAMKGLVLNRDLERAPAIHGSVLLALPEVSTLDSDTFNLADDATLSIELNNNGNIEDLPARSVVEVTFTAGDYTARDVARRIHEELFSRGAGQAAAYPDGQVVVETTVPGLAGSVTIPTPGTATGGADQALLQKLTGGTGELKARGWPGVGFRDPAITPHLRHGYRSKNVGNAQSNAQWIFSDGTATATVNVNNGQTLQDIQRAVDSALATPTGGTNRIGFCLLGTDDTLYIEATGTTLTLQVVVDGNTLATINPGAHEPGGTSERAEEPAVGLRRTHEIRTFLAARDYVGNGAHDEVNDLGWIRPPAVLNGQPDAGSPAWHLRLPFGRYLTAVRADAAKTRDYHSSGDMVISGNTHPADNMRYFVHQVRYWMQFDNAQILGIGKVVRDEGGTEVTYYVPDVLYMG